MLNPRRVLTRAQLLDHVWSYDFSGDARVLETYMSYLRKKVDSGERAAAAHGPRRRLRAAPAEGLTMSLRTRLLTGVFLLVSVALIVAAVAIYAQQRSFLYNRLDQRVIAAATPISYQLGVDARRLRRPARQGIGRG